VFWFEVFKGEMDEPSAKKFETWGLEMRSQRHYIGCFFSVFWVSSPRQT
jgi:hypothetical protein